MVFPAFHSSTSIQLTLTTHESVSLTHTKQATAACHAEVMLSVALDAENAETFTLAIEHLPNSFLALFVTEL